MIYPAEAPSPQEHEVMLAAAHRLGLNPSGAQLASASARFIWHLPAETVALVITRPGSKTASDVAAETGAVRAATAAGVRTPPMLAGPLPVADQRFGLAYGWIDGRSLVPGDWPAAATEAAKLGRVKAGALRRLSWPGRWPDHAWVSILGRELYADFTRHCEQAASAVHELTHLADDLILCHGDLQPLNIIVNGNGQPWLIDMETACLAPLEWDPAKLVILADRFGDPDRLDDVISAWPTLDSDRVAMCVSAQETQVVAWLVEMALAGAPGAAGEARRRARTLRGEKRQWRHLR